MQASRSRRRPMSGITFDMALRDLKARPASRTEQDKHDRQAAVVQEALNRCEGMLGAARARQSKGR